MWNFEVGFNDTSAAPASNGLIFFAPRGTDAKQAGPLIFNQQGQLVWSGVEYGTTMQFTVVSYEGQDHIMLYTGPIESGGYGNGFYLLLNNRYEVVANISTNGLGDAYADIHEGQITSNNTALITSYVTQPYNLTDWGYPDGYVLDGVFQEINVMTGEEIFTWRSHEHVDAHDCYWDPQGAGGTSDEPWDYFHINSIMKDDYGHYLISSRHCHALYYIDGGGDILWSIGGNKSSFEMGEGTSFYWQHDARWLDNHHISVFDNGGTNRGDNETSARGIILELDYQNMKITLDKEFLPYNSTVSQSQGNVQILAKGNALVGWGQVPYISEYTSEGDMVWAARFGLLDDGSISSYRAFRFNCTGRSTELPSINVTTSPSTTIYASWNGATEVNYWQLLGSTSQAPQKAISLQNTTRSDFETPIVWEGGGDWAWFQVAAMNSANEYLSYSDFTAADGSDGQTLPADNQTATASDPVTSGNTFVSSSSIGWTEGMDEAGEEESENSDGAVAPMRWPLHCLFALATFCQLLI